jgi:hypothetical protein
MTAFAATLAKLATNNSPQRISTNELLMTDNAVSKQSRCCLSALYSIRHELKMKHFEKNKAKKFLFNFLHNPPQLTFQSGTSDADDSRSMMSRIINNYFPHFFIPRDDLWILPHLVENE